MMHGVKPSNLLSCLLKSYILTYTVLENKFKVYKIVLDVKKINTYNKIKYKNSIKYFIALFA